MTTAPSLKHLLLDFGVPVLLTPFELIGKAEETLGTISWRGPFDTTSDPEYVRWQAGEITEREYWSVRGAPYGLDLRGLMRDFYEPPGGLSRAAGDGRTDRPASCARGESSAC